MLSGTRHAEYIRFGFFFLSSDKGVIRTGAQCFLILAMYQLGTFFLSQSGRYHGYPQAIAHAVIVSRTKDHGCIIRSVAPDGVHDLAGLTQLEVAPGSNIDQNATGTMQIYTFEQWAGNGLFCSTLGTVLTRGYGSTHHGLTLLTHDGLHVLKVHVDVTFHIDDFSNSGTGVV